MPGASADTKRVTILNANWTPGPDGGDGKFELMLMTGDEERYTLAASPAAITAIVALANSETVLAWDPDGPTLIVANLLGEMPWTRQT